MAESHAPGGRVKLNVGGSVFETAVSTLAKYGDTMLSALIADRWQTQEELFIDRNPTYFAKVLDYLRDGEFVVLPEDSNSLKCLRREAEFFNLPGLADICSAKLRNKYGKSSHGDRVRINVGGKIFVTSLSTLMKEDNLLSAMVAGREGDEELFIDRDPTHFAKVLNYLRDGEGSLPSLDDKTTRDILRKEAEFYGVAGLGMSTCVVGEAVLLRKSAFETYCLAPPLESLRIGLAIKPRQGIPLHGQRCMICGFCVYEGCDQTYVAVEKNCLEIIKGRAYAQSISLEHLKSREGRVLEVTSTCCLVRWDYGSCANLDFDLVDAHVPKSALRLAKPKCQSLFL